MTDLLLFSYYRKSLRLIHIDFFLNITVKESHFHIHAVSHVPRTPACARVLAHGVVARSLGCGTHCGHEASASVCPGKQAFYASCEQRPLLFWARPMRTMGSVRNATWLILPVVICLSQRLSHACTPHVHSNGSPIPCFFPSKTYLYPYSYSSEVPETGTQILYGGLIKVLIGERLWIRRLWRLKKNSTWDLTELPASKRAIDSRWVYKVKLKQDGSVERYKAIIAKDVNNAFLHGYLDEEVYMVPPKGYNKAHGRLACRLKKSLYDLKQTSRQWNIELTSKLEVYSFKQSPNDHCLFTLHSHSSFVALIMCVDDVLLTSSSLDILTVVKRYLDDPFTIKDLGHAKYLLRRPAAQPVYSASSPATLGGYPSPSSLFEGNRSVFTTESSLQLTAFSDSDWASYLDIRHSVTGCCIFLGDSLVYWKTKNKPPSLAPLLKLNTRARDPQFVSCTGSTTFWVNLVFLWYLLSLFTMITRLL
ncbi:UNVERIFIED_CONTAM: Retrovirus-related Pol polyprotein from transposon TNT 1-94 [Sesamum latifolium]|uniref:Retrovirus-related Pol polyprotein from transposon TNT 1-94 n=1 Tax=Sesamum latifolium TaxID=2727402 RepID=A0AAW2WRD9_9LAMI